MTQAAEDKLQAWIAEQDGGPVSHYDNDLMRARAQAETAARHFHYAAQMFLSQVRGCGLNQDTIHGDEGEEMVKAALDMIQDQLAPGVLDIMRAAIASTPAKPDLFEVAKEVVGQ